MTGWVWFRRKVQMKTSEIITLYDLCSQGVELFCGRWSRVSRRPQLSLANRMHDFNPRNRTARRPKRFEAEHGMREAFDRSMVLLHKVVKIFGVANDDGRLMDLVVVVNRGGVAPTLINCNFLRQPLGANGLV